MKFTQHALILTVSLAATLALGGCGKKEDNAIPPASTPATPPPAAQTTPAPAAPVAVAVSAVDLGSVVDGDQKVTTPTTSFGAKDTIYASVATTGAGTAKLDAKWTYQDGQTVNEESTTINPTGPANTAFHIAKPSGWPTGSYKVEISQDGKSVSTKDFSVK
ncbi:hypothetical protein [Dyella sp. GSA-30]|uniref:hypothetical protein n=1 Tax=Dyella sp. GSA-30 TaxID=2994496 RepID=UPI002491345F|nr:hypothetical protein [Dyella sp. GSA-30]BDU19655.1 hypothetical protein DYGSA30_11120 [Dyella sp. GSA-30]